MRTPYVINLMNALSDEDVLARTLYGEARGECLINKQTIKSVLDPGLDGLIAIGCVVMNRLSQKKWYGDSVKNVCHKPYQFSCWNEGDPNLPLLLSIDTSNQVYKLCAMVAQHVMAQNYFDITLGADHYHSVTMKKFPKWSTFATKTVDIGKHRFYKMVILNK